MAKAQKKEEQAALATTASSGLSLQQDELADVLGDVDLGTDGLEETEASDHRIAALVFNFNGVDAAGDPVPKNRFFDTVSEEIKPRVRLALLTMHKSNAFTEFVDGQGTKVRCRSWDRETGETEEGKTRACKGCPHKEWRVDPATGKRTRDCSDVTNIVGLDLDDAQPKIIRVKRTSEKPWKDFLNKHFLGKRIINGKRANYPLFAFETTVSLEMAKGNSGSYARPVFERSEQPFARDEIVYFAEQAKAARDWLLDSRTREVAEGADMREGATVEADGSFDPNEFSDDPMPSAAPADASPNRF